MRLHPRCGLDGRRWRFVDLESGASPIFGLRLCHPSAPETERWLIEQRESMSSSGSFGPRCVYKRRGGLASACDPIAPSTPRLSCSTAPGPCVSHAITYFGIRLCLQVNSLPYDTVLAPCSGSSCVSMAQYFFWQRTVTLHISISHILAAASQGYSPKTTYHIPPSAPL